MHWLGTTLITAFIALLRQTTANMLFQFFKKRTVKLITNDQQRSLERLQKCIIFQSIFCFTTILIAFGIKIDNIQEAHDLHKKQMAQYLCHSFAIISVSLTWIVLTTSMTIMAAKIRKSTNDINEKMLNQVEHCVTHKQRHTIKQVVRVRNTTVRRMYYITSVIVTVAVFLFVYTCYKYLFYSADCQPLNYFSLEANSFMTLVGLGTDFLFWLIPVMIFFWPTTRVFQEEKTYRKARRRWNTLSASLISGNSAIQDYSDGESDDNSSDTYSGNEEDQIDGVSGYDSDKSDNFDELTTYDMVGSIVNQRQTAPI